MNIMFLVIFFVEKQYEIQSTVKFDKVKDLVSFLKTTTKKL